jgi:hypothetical protein
MTASDLNKADYLCHALSAFTGGQEVSGPSRPTEVDQNRAPSQCIDSSGRGSHNGYDEISLTAECRQLCEPSTATGHRTETTNPRPCVTSNRRHGVVVLPCPQSKLAVASDALCRLRVLINGLDGLEIQLPLCTRKRTPVGHLAKSIRCQLWKLDARFSTVSSPSCLRIGVLCDDRGWGYDRRRASGLVAPVLALSSVVMRGP